MDDRELDRRRALRRAALAEPAGRTRVSWALVASAVLAFSAAGCRGEHHGPGAIEGPPVARKVVAEREQRQREAARALAAPVDKRILFGDLHVHTTFSIDAFALSLPIMQGEGLHPPADACDFARYCSALDFWSINDHAEAITPAHWRETIESIRQCNAVAGDGDSPDVVAFLGWEWSQVGDRPQNHYGHKNVVLRDLDDAHIPTRPIAAPPRLLAPFTDKRRTWWERVRVPLYDWKNRRIYLDFGRFQREVEAVEPCEAGVDVRALPPDCHEVADDPAELFEKLAQWGFEAIVIPHGTAWGLYTPPGSRLDKQLKGAQHDPERQTLFEIYSGHGNSEEFRAWDEAATDADGRPICPQPTRAYVPCCWQAGEIIRSRCEDPRSNDCRRRVAEARANYAAAGHYGHLTVPGTEPADWKDCGQCRDCFNPAFNYRPRSSAQYALALGDFDRPGPPRRFVFGFIGSSDNHKARPGTGYKEYGRLAMTEAAGPPSAAWRTRLAGGDPEPAARSIAWGELEGNVRVVRLWEGERQASFFMTGGLAAVHAEGRSREAIWQALRRREVYATSGDRILLWFDLVNAPNGSAPMGATVAMTGVPHFRVRAAGAFRQLPGCPHHASAALAPARLETLCRGECYNPSDERRRITRIEIVRIRPQVRAGEPVEALIEDPWRVFACPPRREGCAVEFTDEEFPAAGREAVYYVRAIQEPTPAVNAGGVRCEYDEEGRCVRARPCYGDWRTPAGDDCLSMNEERAWSSPIYVRHARGK